MKKVALRRISPQNDLPVREIAYEYLRTSVLSGRLAPGERLIEEYLAEKLGVSRTPVREALHKLESEGLIRALETRGFMVSRDSKEEIEELFDIRAILEGYALRLISEKVSIGFLERLKGFIEKAEESLRNERIDEVFKWNTKFHDTLHEMVAEKKRLHRMIVNVRRYVLRYRKDTLRSPDGARRAVEGHHKILLALELRDPDLCERIMREHIQEAKVDAEQFLLKKTKEAE